MKGVLYVAEREVKEKVRDRGFLIFSAFMLLLVLAPLVGSNFFGGGDSEETQDFSVAVAGQDPQEIGSPLRQQGEAQGYEVSLRQAPDAAAAERLVGDGEVDAAVIDGQRAFIGENVGTQQESLLQSAVSSLQTAQVLQQAGVDPQELQAAQEPAPLSVEGPGAEEQEGLGIRLLGAYIGTFLLFLTVYLYGYWVSNGVVEEKSSRVAEVVVSATKTWQLLAGKIIGLGLVGLAQLLLLAAVGLAASVVVGFELPPGTRDIAGTVLLWFLLGYAFYSGLFAVAGALVSRQEELQYTQLPLMVPIFVGLFVVTSNLGNLGTPLVATLSFIPPFTPIIMPARMILGGVSAPEVVAAVALMLVATVAVVWLANRFYRGSILRFGSRVKLSEAWRSARGAGK